MLINTSGIPLSMAVWLANDEYDYNPDPFTISVTTLLRPTKAVILTSRITDFPDTDIKNIIKSSLGTAVHNEIERVWLDREKRDLAMSKLGYPKKVIDRVIVNPSPKQLENYPDAIPVYMEKRSHRKIGKWTISGKFDFVVEDTVTDFKTTSAYKYISQSSSEEYRQQGSIYKWLNQDIIKADHMTIEYLFTDWMERNALIDKNYPQGQIVSQKFTTMSMQEVEIFINSRLKFLDMFMNAEQENMPVCTPTELWQKPSIWKYYKNPASTKRSTKNFKNAADASERLAVDGNVGKIVFAEGVVVRCRYCSAISVCKQAESYIAQDLLKI